MAYCCASVIDLYLQTKFHWNRKKTSCGWTDEWTDRLRTYWRTDTSLSNAIRSSRRSWPKYHLATAESPFTVITIDCVHQTGLRKGVHHRAVCYPHAWRLPKLQLCQSLCQKLELFLTSVAVSQWTVLLGYVTISTSVRRYYQVVYNDFVFQEDSASCVQHSPTAAVQNSQLPFSWAMAQ